MSASPHFTREQWFSLPLSLRQRWWRETDYSKKEPSRDLPTDDLSWHPALSKEQKIAILEGRLRATMCDGVMILETIKPI